MTGLVTQRITPTSLGPSKREYLRHANAAAQAAFEEERAHRQPRHGIPFMRDNGEALTWEQAADIAYLVKAHDNPHTSNLRSRIAGRIMGILAVTTHIEALNEARAIRRKLTAIEKRRRANPFA